MMVQSNGPQTHNGQNMQLSTVLSIDEHIWINELLHAVPNQPYTYEIFDHMINTNTI